MRENIIFAAEAKLGRQLSAEEKSGIDKINSPMMLEFCAMSFSHATTTPEAVAADLISFANQSGQ